ncbi:MAG: glycosyltransferase family 4 protein [Fimbriimonadaceae bacterium]
MNVAIDARLLTTENTGDSSYWKGLVGGLAETDTDHRFLLYSNADRPDFIPDDKRFVWQKVEGGGRFWSLWSFPKAAQRDECRVAHGQYSMSPLHRRSVTTVHDVSFFVEPSWFKPKDRWLLRRSIPGTVKRARRVITVSETSRKEIEEHIPAARGKVTVTYNALGKNVMPMDKAEAQRVVKQELGLSYPFLLTVGTRWPRKNLGLAIESFRLASPHLPHRLVVTGKPGWGELPVAERVDFPGYVSDAHLSALYSAADLFLLPSRHEGFGIPVLEAFACGCPVLCSSGGALPEVAGEAAQVEPSWQAKDWAVAIKALLSDSSKLEAMRQRGYKRLARFSWSETARRTIEVYEEAAQ